MPFSPITVNSKTFNQNTEGLYMLSTVGFGQPRNFIQIRGAAVNKDKTLYIGTISRVIQKDVTVGGVTTRKQLRVQLLVESPTTDFTASEIDTAVLECCDWITPAITDRFMTGES